eukprot:m.228147 g.228147  ORF g.228147 m.228147 type:complete len:667 (+) comp11702_c0_seq1:22-2022(+)
MAETETAGSPGVGGHLPGRGTAPLKLVPRRPSLEPSAALADSVRHLGSSLRRSSSAGSTRPSLIQPPPVDAPPMGGMFSSTVTFQRVALPAILNDSSSRGFRNQALFNGRYLVTADGTEFALEGETIGPSASSDRFRRGQLAITEARLLKASTAAHSSTRGNYMLVGQHMAPKSKGDIDEAELVRLERLALEQAPPLYLTKGLLQEQQQIRARAVRERKAAEAVARVRPRTTPARLSVHGASDSASSLRSGTLTASDSTLRGASSVSARAPIRTPVHRTGPSKAAAVSPSPMVHIHDSRSAVSIPSAISVVPVPVVVPAPPARTAQPAEPPTPTTPQSVSFAEPGINVGRAPMEPRETAPRKSSLMPIPFLPKIGRRSSSSEDILTHSTSSAPRPSVFDLPRRKSYTEFVAEFEREPDDEEVRSYQVRELFNMMGPRQQEIFTEKFHELDTDHDGLLSINELHSALGGRSTTNEVRNLCQLLKVGSSEDEDTKGEFIDCKDFLCVAALNDKLQGKRTRRKDAMTVLNVSMLGESIRMYKSMFYLADHEHLGHLTMDSLKVLLTAAFGIDIGSDPALARTIMQTIDKDDSGHIEFHEFIMYIPFFMRLHTEIITDPLVTGRRWSSDTEPPLLNALDRLQEPLTIEQVNAVVESKRDAVLFETSLGSQ